MTVKLDQSPAARQRREQTVEARMASVTATGSDRAAARKQIEADVEREELQAAETKAAEAEATAERSRIAAIVSAGTDMGRPKQALRLALAGPLGDDQARSILSGLPLDQDAPEAALTLPEAGAFGSEAAQAERRRIGSVFAHPAAAGRFKSACALALEGAEAIPVDAIAAILGGLPPDAETPRFASLEERAADLAEFGGDGGDIPVGMTAGEKAAQGWSWAVNEANSSIGVKSEEPRRTGSAASADDDAAFGTVDALPEGVDHG
jgi:hypothetical protein